MQSAEFKVQNEEGNGLLRSRTKLFALRIIRLHSALDGNRASRVLGDQLLRSGTSAGAHYREACRARSVAEFVSKMEGDLAELDETGYWLELLNEAQIVPSHKLSDLRAEASELMALFIASVKTSKRKRHY